MGNDPMWASYSSETTSNLNLDECIPQSMPPNPVLPSCLLMTAVDKFPDVLAFGWKISENLILLWRFSAPRLSETPEVFAETQKRPRTASLDDLNYTKCGDGKPFGLSSESFTPISWEEYLYYSRFL
ncbi:hypothetical protein FE257_003559 [Aspergillus nanangensis]|uniref:Uncharacterized protein n=1 Tax=Aspergillus nanangensis TaxID=2582783 RepID=A0AAD4CBS5_ASPNN|nr:hypothetical protein FE257_003559 [Aspergillus nanangensis]